MSRPPPPMSHQPLPAGVLDRDVQIDGAKEMLMEPEITPKIVRADERRAADAT